MSFWRAVPEGVTVRVKVHPRSRRPSLGGRMDSAMGECLRVAVTEAAEDGRASRAVCDSLAQALDVPRASVRIVAGAASREKLLAVTGDAAALSGKLAAL